MHVKTTDTNKVWQSPDGQKNIWDVKLARENGDVYALKTYSPKIAELGFQGDVESYVNRHGDRFVRQVKKEQPADNSRDANIRAQWAIGQAIALASATMDKQAISLTVIENYAKDFYDTVSRVKGEELSPAEREQAANIITRQAKAQTA